MSGYFFRLYAKPSFREGIARLFDMGGELNEYNYSRDELEADYRAILSDWAEVGYDIRGAIARHEELVGVGDDER